MDELKEFEKFWTGRVGVEGVSTNHFTLSGEVFTLSLVQADPLLVDLLVPQFVVCVFPTLMMDHQ